MTKVLTREPDVILKNGEPKAVILDIKEYKEILERLEDIEDLKELKTLRKGTLKFRKIEDFLKDNS